MKRRTNGGRALTAAAAGLALVVVVVSGGSAAAGPESGDGTGRGVVGFFPGPDAKPVSQASSAKWGEKACGPAALLNAMKFGSEPLGKAYGELVGDSDDTRLNFVIDRYFRGRKSTGPAGGDRFSANGVSPEDLTAAWNDFLGEKELEPVTGEHLDRRDGEEFRDYLGRMHRELRRSLVNGVPPVISLRSYVARYQEEEGDHYWEVAKFHYVVVTSVPDRLRPEDPGFQFEYVDPDGGRLGSAYLYPEVFQPFSAFKGDVETGEWKSGSEFLLVTAPAIHGLIPKDLDWKERWIIALTFMAGR